MGNDVRFIGYRDILGAKYHELVRMLWSRSSLFRSLTTPLWLLRLNESFFEMARAFNPDLILSIKGETLLPRYIGKIKNETGARLALWFPDDPRFFNSLTSHIAPYYDAIFTSSRRAIEQYKSISVNNVSRLPFACDPKIHKGILDPSNLIRRALFIGTYSPKRYSFIRKLVKAGAPIDIIGSKWRFPFDRHVVGASLQGMEYVHKLQSYSMVLNIHQDVNYGPNMRTFEVTGSGGVLLTDRGEDINDFFLEGTDMLVYDSIEDAALKIKYIIKNPEVSYEIASNAQKKCYQKETYDERARQILRHLRI